MSSVALSRLADLVLDTAAQQFGDTVTITGERGSVTLPVEVTADLPDGVVWVPANSFGGGVLRDLGRPNSRVSLSGGDR